MEDNKSTTTIPSKYKKLPLRQKKETSLMDKEKTRAGLRNIPHQRFGRLLPLFKKRGANLHADYNMGVNLTSSMYVHFLVFLNPLLWLIAGLYLWSTSLVKGPFNLLFLLDVFTLPSQYASLMSNEIYAHAAQGFANLKEKTPHFITSFLAQTYLNPRKWLAYLLLFYGGYKFLKALIYKQTTSLQITPHVLIIHHGLLKPEIIEISSTNISLIQIRKGPCSQFFNVGRVIVQTSGGFIIELPSLKNPSLLQSSVRAQLSTS